MFAIPPLLIFSRHCKMNSGYRSPDVYTDTHWAFFFEGFEIAMCILIHTAPTIVYRCFVPCLPVYLGATGFACPIPITPPLERSPAAGGAEAIAAPGGDGASIAQMYICAACRGNPLTPMPPAGGYFAAQAAGRRNTCLRNETLTICTLN